MSEATEKTMIVETIANLNGQIANLQDENEQLKFDVKHWKAQVVRLENELRCERKQKASAE